MSTVLELTSSFSFVADVRAGARARLQWISDNVAGVLGYASEEIASPAGPTPILHPDDIGLAEAMVRAIVDGEHPQDELRVVAKDGSTHWLRIRYRREGGGDPRGWVRLFGVCQDVTDEVEARDEAAANAARWRSMFERSPYGKVVLSADQCITAVNAAVCALTGYAESELVGWPASRLVDPAFLSQAQSRFVDDVKNSAEDRLEHPSVWRAKDGRRLEVELTVVPERDLEAIPYQYFITVLDVTDRDRAAAEAGRAEQERRQLLERIVEAHGEERVRVARELHDGLGQILTSASLFASSIAEDAPPELAGSLAALRGLLDESLAATRTLVWRLRPIEVDELGLAGAVATLAEKTQVRSGVQVDAHVGALGYPLLPAAELAIFRVVQEAVTNAVRHARAHAISIVLTQRDDVIVAVVEDDGLGFDVLQDHREGPSSGYGLVGMHERAESVSGALVVESRPGAGTMVRLEVPVDRKAEL
jgi:PAS domain S-box-containing protein